LRKHFPLLSGGKVAGIKGHIKRAGLKIKARRSEFVKKLCRQILSLDVNNQRAQEHWAVLRAKLRQCQPTPRTEDPHEFTVVLQKDVGSSQTLEEAGDTDAGTVPAPKQNIAPTTFCDKLVSRSTSAMLHSRVIGCGNSSRLCNVLTPSAQALLAEQAKTPPLSQDTTTLSPIIQNQISSDESLTKLVLDDCLQPAIFGPSGLARSFGGDHFRSEGSGSESGVSIMCPRNRTSQKGSILRLRWMWADGVGRATWSLPRTPELLAAELDKRREVRTLQIRQHRDRKSWAFPKCK